MKSDAKTAGPSTMQKIVALVALSSTGTAVGMFSKLAQVGGKYKFSPASAVVCTEFFKLIVSLLLILKLAFKGELLAKREASMPMREELKIFFQENISMIVVAHELGLAVAYTVVNLATYAIFIHASGSMFFLLKASSPVVTAVLLYLLVSRKLSKPQWLAVCMQCVGLFGTQLDPCGATPAVSAAGYALILINIVVSCVAGVWNEHIIKNYGTSVNAQNTVLYTGGVIINLLLFWFAPPQLIGSAAGDNLGFFEGYNASVFAVIAANGSVGLVITAVYKYADVVIKTFGLAGSTMTLYIMEMVGIIPGGRAMPVMTTLAGAAAVFYASYIYILPGTEFQTTTPAAGAEDEVEVLLPFDVMSLEWGGAVRARKVRNLLLIGASVVIVFLISKWLCTLGMSS